MKLDPVLLEILVCPDCKGSLTVDHDHDELICNRCGLIYPVRDDIPVMLVEEARRPEKKRPDNARATGEETRATGDQEGDVAADAETDSGSAH